MKQPILIFTLFILFQSCILFPRGSDIRTGIIRSINKDTINFYGSKKKFILENMYPLKVQDTIQYTTLTNSSFPIIRKL